MIVWAGNNPSTLDSSMGVTTENSSFKENSRYGL
jgi:hypothetical protein